MEREVDHFAGIGHASYGSVTIKVSADSHMLDSHDVDGMLKMGYGIEYGGLASLGEEPFVKRYVGNTTLLGQRSHLFVSEISRNITESLTVGVAANDGLTADFECVVEAFLRTMTQINHDAVLIHLLNHLDTKLADTIMEAAATCRVANVIVTVVAKGDIDYSTLGKMLHILKSVLQCQTVFNSKHDAVAALPLVFVEVGRCASYAQVTIVGLYNFLNLVEDEVGIGRRCQIVEHVADFRVIFLEALHIDFR